MSYRYLLDLALILLSTKVLSLVTKRFKLPQVVGALLAGLILGPAVFNVIDETFIYLPSFYILFSNRVKFMSIKI